jgi:chemotaxis protein MotB
MSAHRRHKKHPPHEEHENHERWLVSGFDMMTLLFAVFVVLFAISSVNISKVEALSQSLQEALSGPVFDGGRAMMQTGATSTETQRAAPEPPVQAISPSQAVQNALQGDASGNAAEAAAKAAKEEQGFMELKRRLDKLVAEAGLGKKVSTTVTPDGLRIRLLTDDLFFASGSASIASGAVPVLDHIGGIIATERKHPISVEGHTDDRVIQSSQFPSNWQLSGARAAAVVQRLTAAGVNGKRVTLSGYADERPIAANTSADGRAQNRRVEIILTRQHGANSPQGGGTTP